MPRGPRRRGHACVLRSPDRATRTAPWGDAASRRRAAMATMKYRTADVDGMRIFYREAGARRAPDLLLLHGFPSAGHMFRDLIPLVAGHFHVVAPDLPGFGQSGMPARNRFSYTFDAIAGVIDRFTEVVGLDRFAIYV